MSLSNTVWLSLGEFIAMKLLGAAADAVKHTSTIPNNEHEDKSHNFHNFDDDTVVKKSHQIRRLV